ncbi:unnamed protein product [Brassica napus]|uniref:(rape) hypothetical protein n=1 Tax=Brassica napus TaxID=3708 RepID=A0A816XIK6_BRANA|nr:unnamed protein product [Brassica napus]
MFDAFASLACSLLYLSGSGTDSFWSVHVFFFDCVPISLTFVFPSLSPTFSLHRFGLSMPEMNALFMVTY